MLNWSLNGTDQITTTKNHFELMTESSEERIMLTYNSQVQLHIPCGWVSIIHPASVNPLVHDRDPEKTKALAYLLYLLSMNHSLTSLSQELFDCLTRFQPWRRKRVKFYKEEKENLLRVKREFYKCRYFSKEGWNLKLARVPKPKVGSADQCLAVFWWSTRKISFWIV